MDGNFQHALGEVLKSEGGKVDNPRDLGGRTNHGVTQKVYDNFRRLNGDEPRDVFEMGDGDRDGIYRRYWDAVGGDNLPTGLDYEAFDTAVNMGRRKGEPIGSLAKEFLDRIDRTKPVPEQIEQYRGFRQKFYEGIKGPGGFQTFGKGWTNRNEEVAGRSSEWWANYDRPYPPPQAATVRTAAPTPSSHFHQASAAHAVRSALALGPGTYATTHRHRHSSS